MGARLVSSRLLFGGETPEAVTTYLGREVSTEPSWWPGNQDQGSPVERIIDFPLLALSPSERQARLAWRLDLQGAWQMLSDEQDRLMVAMAQGRPDWKSNDIQFRIACCDALDLQIDPALVDDYVAMVHELSAIAENAVVIRLPENHTDGQSWLSPSKEGLERKRSVIRTIEERTGLSALNFEDMPGLNRSDFYDSTHLSRSGRARFAPVVVNGLLARGLQTK